MKKIAFFCSIAFLVQLNSYSQTSQGSIVVGGEISLTTSNNKTEHDNHTSDGPVRTHFSLIPDIEYFLTDNLSAGIGIGYSIDKYKNDNSVTETVQKDGLFVMTPYLKKYFPMGDRAYIFGEAQLGLGFGKEVDESTTGGVTIKTTDAKHSYVSIGIVPGFRFNVSQKVGLEAGIGFIGFSHDVHKTGSGNDETRNITNSVHFSFIPNSLTLGIRYTLK